MKNILRRNRRTVRGMAVAAAVLIFTIGTAKAIFTLKLTTGLGATKTVLDGGAGDLDGVVNGVISTTGAVGVFSVNVTTSLSKPVLGSPYLAFMDLNSVNVNAGGADTLLIETSDTDFSILGSPTSLVHFTGAGGTLTAPAGSSIVFSAAVDGGNVLFAYDESILTVGPFGPGAYSGTNTTTWSPTSFPFSMSQKAFIDMKGAGTVSFDHEHKVLVPEGSSVAMMLMGLGPLGLILRRRMKKA